MAGSDKIIVALDVDELREAGELLQQLSGSGVIFKVGNQLGTFEGWRRVIETVHSYGAQIFCDTKFKDIPETVKKSARAITRLEPEFIDIMADTDPACIVAAVEGIESAVRDFGVKRPILLGVTVLTSMSDETCHSVYGGSPQDKVLQFASTAADAGIDGIVCSAKETKLLRSHERTKDLILVTPGIRPLWASSGDQSRVMTPQAALNAGADYLVIGRPITQPPIQIGNPLDAINKITEELHVSSSTSH